MCHVHRLRMHHCISSMWWSLGGNSCKLMSTGSVLPIFESFPFMNEHVFLRSSPGFSQRSWSLSNSFSYGGDLVQIYSQFYRDFMNEARCLVFHDIKNNKRKNMSAVSDFFCFWRMTTVEPVDKSTCWVVWLYGLGYPSPCFLWRFFGRRWKFCIQNS